MAYLVIYRTATHIGYRIHETDREARADEHLSPRWSGSLYRIDDPEGFTQAEAKDLYNHGIAAMAPGWRLTEIDA